MCKYSKNSKYSENNNCSENIIQRFYKSEKGIVSRGWTSRKVLEINIWKVRKCKFQEHRKESSSRLRRGAILTGVYKEFTLFPHNKTGYVSIQSILRMIVLVFLECTKYKLPKWKKESCLDFGLPGRFWKSENWKLRKCTFQEQEHRSSGVLEF